MRCWVTYTIPCTLQGAGKRSCVFICIYMYIYIYIYIGGLGYPGIQDCIENSFKVHDLSLGKRWKCWEVVVCLYRLVYIMLIVFSISCWSACFFYVLIGLSILCWSACLYYGDRLVYIMLIGLSISCWFACLYYADLLVCITHYLYTIYA